MLVIITIIRIDIHNGFMRPGAEIDFHQSYFYSAFCTFVLDTIEKKENKFHNLNFTDGNIVPVGFKCL